jgi:hypothetical protein
VLSSKRAIKAPTAIPVLPRVLIMFASHSGSSVRGLEAKYSGTLNPMKNAKPRIKRFLVEYFASNPLTLDPEWLANIINTLGSTGMAVGAFIALLLDNTVPGTDKERGLTAWGRK